MNVLVFFCDQLRLDLLGCYGGRMVRTPNLDALARRAVVFDRAYTPTAICSPARASLMTGLYPHRHHLFTNSSPGYSYCEHLRSGLMTIADWADAAGSHETAYFGKWHIGPARDFFASAFHRKHPEPHADGPAFLASSHWHPDLALGPLARPFADGTAGAIDVPMERFPDVYVADQMRRFLRGRSPDARPFLGFCAFPGPHSPWLVPADFGIRYDVDDIPLWPNRDDPLEGKPINQRKLRSLESRRDQGHLRAGLGRRLREQLVCLFSYLELIDTLVGDLLAELAALGLADSTTVVFTADHGDMAGAHGFLSKGAYGYDEIYRIPLLIAPPGRTAERRVGAPVHLMDMTATLLDLMGGREQERLGDERLHGRSLRPLLDADVPWRPVHYGEYHGDWYGHYSLRLVTDGRWKLVWNFSDRSELYELGEDPGELCNRFDDPACSRERRRLFDLLYEQARLTEDRQALMLAPAVEDADAAALRAGG